jgi:hypothetical protein
VTLNVCNAGKVDVDAYLVQQGSVSTKHIAPADCAPVAQTQGPMASGTIAFGFTDAKGQWSGARRTDTPPDFNSFLDRSIGLPTILEHANTTVTVKHGAASVTVPGVLAFRPQPPWCDAPTPSHSYVASLPLNATPSQIAQAKALDAGSPSSGQTYCHSQYYNLTVIPYTDSREIGLDTMCDPCEAKEEAVLTPQEKAANDRAVDDGIAFVRTLPGFNSTGFGKVVTNMYQAENDRQKAEKARRAEIAKGPYVMNWKDLSAFITSAFGVRGMAPLMANRHIILRGTVARVEMPNAGAQFPSVHVYFKDTGSMEKPPEGLPGDYFINPYVGNEQAFGMCASDPSIMSEIFGANYGTSTAGKTVEMEGEVNRGACGTAAGIQVMLARQLKVVTPGMAMANGRSWAAAPKPVSANPSTPASSPEVRNAPTGAVPTRAPVRPAPAPAAGASEKLIAAIENPKGTPTTPTSPAQRNAACQAQANRQYPNDSFERAHAFADCMQAASASAGQQGATGAVPTDPPQRDAVAPPAPVAVPAPPMRGRTAPQPAPETVAAAPVRDPLVTNVLNSLRTKAPEIRILLMLKQQKRPLTLSADDRARLEETGASEKLIAAMENPSSIGPEVTPQAVAEAVREENDAKRLANTCRMQANRQYPNDSAARDQAVENCMKGK